MDEDDALRMTGAEQYLDRSPFDGISQTTTTIWGPEYDAFYDLSQAYSNFGVYLVRGVSSVPEPSITLLMILGLVGIAFTRMKNTAKF
jgi:hypothetical protein